MNSTQETIRIELSYVASQLRAIRNDHPSLFEPDQSRLEKLRFAVGSIGEADDVERRITEIEASFDRVARELDVPSYPELNERLTALQSACRQDDYQTCLRLATELLRECEEELEIDPLYEGTDPFAES